MMTCLFSFNCHFIKSIVKRFFCMCGYESQYSCSNVREEMPILTFVIVVSMCIKSALKSVLKSKREAKQSIPSLQASATQFQKGSQKSQMLHYKFFVTCLCSREAMRIALTDLTNTVINQPVELL